jgi:hypothetical protein
MKRSEAEEHLRVIRSLMEKATVYRAVSAPAALTGGLLSAAVGAVLLLTQPRGPAGLWTFLGGWLAVLLVTFFANVYFLTHGAGRTGGGFLSPGMRMALQALLPSQVVALVLTTFAAWGVMIHAWPDAHLALPSAWCVLYGLGLLATAHFAPTSLIVLGWSFLAAGLLAVVGQSLGGWTAGLGGVAPEQVANGIMTLTFGLFHIVYAIRAWPRTAERE